jgi:peptide/nickel transport system permease protein
LTQATVALPGLLVVLVVVTWAERGSLVLLAAVIGLFGWPSVARLVRAELLRIRTLEYVVAGRALGFSSARLFWRHALPNALSPVLVFLAFGFAAAVLIEASLSFFRIGLPPETVTWGRMLQMGYEYRSDWWLSVFPGLALLTTLIGLFGLGDAIRR